MFIIEIFLNNDYSLCFIFDAINIKIKKLFLSNNLSKNLPENNENELIKDIDGSRFHIYLM